MAAALELRAIADGGDDCRGGLGADTLDLRDPLASIVFAEDLVDLLVKGSDPPVKRRSRPSDDARHIRVMGARASPQCANCVTIM